MKETYLDNFIIWGLRGLILFIVILIITLSLVSMGHYLTIFDFSNAIQLRGLGYWTFALLVFNFLTCVGYYFFISVNQDSLNKKQDGADNQAQNRMTYSAGESEEYWKAEIINYDKINWNKVSLLLKEAGKDWHSLTYAEQSELAQKTYPIESKPKETKAKPRKRAKRKVEKPNESEKTESDKLAHESTDNEKIQHLTE